MKMKKFRAKINAPFVKKDKIYEVDDKGFYGMNLSHSYYEIMLNNYPDLFEPVEEKSNKDKWYEAFYLIAIKEVYKEENKEKKLSEIRADILEKIAKVLDDHGHIAHHIYKEVCGEG